MNKKSKKMGTENTKSNLILWKDFLESIPPDGKTHKIANVFEQKIPDSETGKAIAKSMGLDTQIDYAYSLLLPKLNLFCDSVDCGGIRQFSSGDTFQTGKGKLLELFHQLFLRYFCKNCGKTQKIYVVLLRPTSQNHVGEVTKVGEHPPFGPHIPKRLEKLFDKENLELFRQGRRAENHGLGIGALTYYRRVVVNQKTQLIEKIISVAEKEGASKLIIERLKKAKDETKFSKSVDIIKNTIPESLKIKTHNPLTLLHQPLSVNIHSKTDQECLALATHIRTILTTFSEKLNEALKEDTELNEAIKALTTKSK